MPAQAFGSFQDVPNEERRLEIRLVHDLVEAEFLGIVEPRPREHIESTISATTLRARLPQIVCCLPQIVQTICTLTSKILALLAISELSYPPGLPVHAELTAGEP